LIAVAIPLAAKVLEPVVPAGDKRIVSVVIAIVTTPASFWLINVIAVPIGKATLELAGIVNVLAVVSADGWRMCLPESARTKVYAALWLFCGMFLNPTTSVPSTVRVFAAPLIVEAVITPIVAVFATLSVEDITTAELNVAVPVTLAPESIVAVVATIFAVVMVSPEEPSRNSFS
jgi:hypothetical protein